MFRAYLVSALVAVCGFGYSQYKGWDPLATEEGARIERRTSSGSWIRSPGYRSGSYSHK